MAVVRPGETLRCEHACVTITEIQRPVTIDLAALRN